LGWLLSSVEDNLALARDSCSMEVVIVAPDTSEEAFRLPCCLGRGRPASLRDVATSRKQFNMSAMDGVHDAIRLEAAGSNGGWASRLTAWLLLQPRESSAPRTSQRTVPAADVLVETQQGGSWQLKDFLEPGSSTVVGPGARFFVASRMGTTCITVRAIRAVGAHGGAASAAGPAAAAAAGPAMPSERPASQQQQQQQRIDLDAELAAALAEADSGDEGSHPPEGSDAGAWQGRGSEGDGGCPEQQPAKRRRAGDAGASAAASGTGQRQQQQQQDAPGDPDCPARLMWVRGLAPRWNTGCFGARLRNIVQGGRGVWVAPAGCGAPGPWASAPSAAWWLLASCWLLVAA
jgi:hypothetical protein